MNISPLKNYTGGIGNGHVSVNGISIAFPAGCNTSPAWLNDHTVIYQSNSGGTSILETYDVTSGWKTPVATGGATYLYAKNDVWAACLYTNPLKTIIKSGLNPPVSINDTRPWSVAGDGTILLSDKDNTILYLYNMYGVLLRELRIGEFLEATHYSSNKISYKLSNGKFYWDEIEFQLLPNPFNIKYVDTDSFGDHIVYQTDGIATVHNRQYLGWTFGADGQTNGPDALIQYNGDMLAVYARNEGESPESIETIEFFANSKHYVKPPMPIPPTKTNNAYPRRIFFCPYQSYNSRPDWGVTEHYVGNIVLPDKEFYDKLDLAFIMYDDQIDFDYLNRTLAYYLHVNPNNLTLAKQRYENLINNYPEKPIIFYFDGHPFVKPDWIDDNRTWLGIQNYRNEGESITAFEARMHSVMINASGYDLPLVITPMFYDRLFHTEQQIIECMPVYDDLIREYFVIGVMPFSDCRPGGMKDNPILYQYAEQIYNAIPERPNRYDYWVSSNYRNDMKQQLNYSTLVLSSQQRKIWKEIIG